MKKLNTVNWAISFFLIFTSVSVTNAVAGSPGYEAIVNGAIYGSLDSDVCGLHVEKDNGDLILTFINNPLFPETRCGIIGTTSIAACNSTNACTSKLVGNFRIRLRLLADGNFVYYGAGVDPATGEVGEGQTKFVRFLAPSDSGRAHSKPLDKRAGFLESVNHLSRVLGPQMPADFE
jgi:hypothetical protein